MSENYLIALDACCLNRPFDDQNQLRIKLEAEAILEIIYYCQLGRWQLFNSTVLESEIGQISSQTKKEQVERYLALAKCRILVTPEIIKKVKQLTNFKDDSLFKKVLSCQDKVNARVANPIPWLIGDENDTN